MPSAKAGSEGARVHLSREPGRKSGVKQSKKPSARRGAAIGTLKVQHRYLPCERPEGVRPRRVKSLEILAHFCKGKPLSGKAKYSAWFRQKYKQRYRETPLKPAPSERLSETEYQRQRVAPKPLKGILKRSSCTENGQSGTKNGNSRAKRVRLHQGGEGAVTAPVTGHTFIQPGSPEWPDWLPASFRLEVRPRQSGKASDKYYHAPNGTKLRSKREVLELLEVSQQADCQAEEQASGQAIGQAEGGEGEEEKEAQSQDQPQDQPGSIASPSSSKSSDASEPSQSDSESSESRSSNSSDSSDSSLSSAASATDSAGTDRGSDASPSDSTESGASGAQDGQDATGSDGSGSGSL